MKHKKQMALQLKLPQLKMMTLIKHLLIDSNIILLLILIWNKSGLWCPGRDSNPHDHNDQQILSLLRLPFRHLGKKDDRNLIQIRSKKGNKERLIEDMMRIIN